MHLEHNLVTEIVVFKMLQFSFFFFSEIRRNIRGETLFLEENISTEQIRNENNTLTLYKTSNTPNLPVDSYPSKTFSDD